MDGVPAPAPAVTNSKYMWMNPQEEKPAAGATDEKPAEENGATDEKETVAADDSADGATDKAKPADDTTSEKPAEGAVDPAAQASMDNMAKLKEAARLRRQRRAANRPQEEAPPEPKPTSTSGGEVDAAEVEKLRSDLASARLEMASMRRNHVNNVKKISSERDMFAIQLSKEQETASPESKRAIDELRAELTASKFRVKNLEEENTGMRTELKELRLRDQAFKTMDAANSGYDSIVNDLISVKLKLATVSEEKDNLSYENRVLKADNENLSTANGLLEKSRTEWVEKCADIERKVQEGETFSISTTNAVSGRSGDRSEKSLSINSSDLQELAL